MGGAAATFSRRRVASLLGGAIAAGHPMMRALASVPAASHAASRHLLAPEDVAFLEDLERRGCLYFSEQASRENGQVLDRARNRVASVTRDPRHLASIAATGFGLTALCIAHRRRYRGSEEIRQQVLRTLDFHLHKMPQEHGFLYHFNDIETGQRMGGSELSSIDTSIFLCGVLTCRAYFEDSTIKDLATALYQRVDWPWMMNGGKTLSMGWHPEKGFLPSRWDHYCELMMIYLLAIGSPTHPISPDAWNQFSRPRIQFAGFDYISGEDPLFVHQYTHAWFDFAGRHDAYADYFVNSVTATRAHKAFCLSLDHDYSEDYWGITASDWQQGYTAWGGPPLLGPVDGSVVPSAAAGSLPFLPAECLHVLRSLKQKYGGQAWGRYGFSDAFHPARPWFDPDVLGIDLGIGVLMAENLRTGFVWKTFMQNAEIITAMKRCGFKSNAVSTAAGVSPVG